MFEIDIGYAGRERTEEERQQMEEEMKNESREYSNDGQSSKKKEEIFINKFAERQNQYNKYKEKRGKKLPWEELYSSTVNDFNDDYNLSNEEREKRNKYYAYHREFTKGGYKCNNVIKYVTKARISIKWLYDIYLDVPKMMTSEYNMSFMKFLKKAKSDAEKLRIFHKRENEGKNVSYPDLSLHINLGSWMYPKFKPKKNTRRYDEKYLEEFIFSDKDVSELIPDNESFENELIITDENLDDVGKRLFGSCRWEELKKPLPEDELFKRQYDPDEDFIDDHPTLAVIGTEEDAKEWMKFDDFRAFMTDIASKERGRSRLRSITDIRNDDEMSYFDERDYTTKKGKKGKKYNYQQLEIPKFNGDIDDKDAFDIFMNKIDEYEDRMYYQCEDGKVRTGEEIDILELKEFLSMNGWKINALRGIGGKDKNNKSNKKKRKSHYDKVQKIKRKLTKGKIKEKVGVKNKKKKNKKKNKKDNYDKLSRKEREKEINKYKKEQSDDLDAILLNAVNREGYDSLDDWRASIES